ncbi:FKBP-type peptidyl-prolyl cis-trans isomerase [Flavobacterium psychrotrophum]|uniref:FKBP-type peptidyl-prolyl cis-trans isomerase n=1 Tax=Flavobacterium psychrotrophum TaxID=2294119 RepID=UPI000E31E176|nr:FKBP-type peptidylprolyl isomerase [Flavobacterium psychrotrophum]
MNRFLKAFGLIALITFFASCKKDDDNVAPPRDFGVQYASEQDSIEKYLKNHYISNADIDNIRFDSIKNPATQVSIWDQTLYPLQYKMVKSTNEKNTVEYKVYYLNFRQGSGDRPTRGDNILISYRGWMLNDTQFDYQPFPNTQLSLYTDVYVEGWKNIIPLFNAGTYTDIPDNPNPANFNDYGVGVMFIPSGLAYYNSGSGLIGAYRPIVFSFRLYAVTYTDLDGDGILNKDELDLVNFPNVSDIEYVDTDADGTPNYRDQDDDGDGYSTRLELRKPKSVGDTSTNYEYYDVNSPEIITGSGQKVHLDPNVHSVQNP